MIRQQNRARSPGRLDESGIESYARRMKTVSLELPDTLEEELTAQASRTGLSTSELVQKALTSDLSKASEPVVPKPGSSIPQGVQHLVGCLEGPEDLSTNKKYLNEYGR